MIARMHGKVRWPVLVTLLFLPACVSSLEVEGYKCADFLDARLYYGREVSERLVEVRGYPIEKQYAVFICGAQYMRPPLLFGIQPLAERGKLTIDFLKTKLQSKQSDLVVRDILTLIGYMDAGGQYAAAEDQELMLALETAISGMSDELLKQSAWKRLQRIRRQ